MRPGGSYRGIPFYIKKPTQKHPKKEKTFFFDSQNLSENQNRKEGFFLSPKTVLKKKS
jgi:hypothetical protein